MYNDIGGVYELGAAVPTDNNNTRPDFIFFKSKKKESVKTLQTHQQHLHKYIITFITTFFLIKVLLYTFIFFFLFAKGEYSLFCMYTYRILTLPLFLTPHLRLAFTNRIIQKWTNCPTKVSLFTFYNLFV